MYCDRWIISIVLLHLHIANGLIVSTLTGQTVSIIPHKFARFGSPYPLFNVPYTLANDVDPNCCHGSCANFNNSVAVISRGECRFSTKVLNAQSAGAIGVIIYNDIPMDDHSQMNLVRMATTPEYAQENDLIEIPSIFVSNIAGTFLIGSKLIGNPLLVTVNFTGELEDDSIETSPALLKAVLVVFRIFVLGWAVLVLCFGYIFVKDCRERFLRLQIVRSLPIYLFHNGNEDQDTDSDKLIQHTMKPLISTKHKKYDKNEHAYHCDQCVICLSDFQNNDLLVALPCQHIYHKGCIEPWLIKKSALCPICKQSILPSGESDPMIRWQEVTEPAEIETTRFWPCCRIIFGSNPCNTLVTILVYVLVLVFTSTFLYTVSA